MKILHFADLHLDIPFATSRMPVSVAQDCRRRLRQTLHRILDFAIERKVDVITVGGDLFEADRVSRDTLNFITTAFQQLAPLPILISPGNHDYYYPSSPYARIKWPDNVHIFKDSTLQPCCLNDEIAIWGVAHTAPAERKNLIQDFTVPQDGRVHLLLLHGSEMSSDTQTHSAHAPFKLQHVQEAGFAFAMLGHYHGARILEMNRPVAVYPGSPQPLNFNQNQQHSLALITVHPDYIECECIPTATQAFLTVPHSLDDAKTTDDVGEALLDKVAGKASEANFLRVILSGLQNHDLQLDVAYLKQFLMQHFDFVEIANSTHSSYELSAIAKEPTLRGDFTRKLQHALAEAGDDRALIRRALQYGLEAFDGEKKIGT